MLKQKILIAPEEVPNLELVLERELEIARVKI